MLVLWGIYLLSAKRREKKAEIKVEKEACSAADFSIMIEGVPTDLT